QGNTDRAQDSFQQAVTLDGKYFDADMAMAQLLLNRQQSDSALQYAQKMEQLQPNRSEGYFFAASALGNLHRYPEATSAIQRFMALSPNSSLGPSHLGYLLTMEKQWPAAQRAFEQALALNPADTEALAGLAVVYNSSQQGNRVVGMVQAQMARAQAAKAPASVLAAMQDELARAYVQQKDLGAAQQALERSVSLDPHNFNTYVLLGILFAQQKSFDKAQQQFTQATVADPNSAGLWTMLGMLDEQLNRTDQAEQAYQRAVTIDPNNGVADNNLASLLSAQPKQLDQALTLAQRAKRVLPTVPNVNDTLGWIYVNQGVYQLAIPLLQQAVSAQPDKSEFHVHLATALYRSGRKPEARAQLADAIRIDKNLASQADIAQMLRN